MSDETVLIAPPVLGKTNWLGRIDWERHNRAKRAALGPLPISVDGEIFGARDQDRTDIDTARRAKDLGIESADPATQSAMIHAAATVKEAPSSPAINSETTPSDSTDDQAKPVSEIQPLAPPIIIQQPESTPVTASVDAKHLLAIPAASAVPAHAAAIAPSSSGVKPATAIGFAIAAGLAGVLLGKLAAAKPVANPEPIRKSPPARRKAVTPAQK